MIVKDGSTVILAVLLEIVHHNLTGLRGAPLGTCCWTALVKIPCIACDFKIRDCYLWGEKMGYITGTGEGDKRCHITLKRKKWFCPIIVPLAYMLQFGTISELAVFQHM